MFIIIIYFVMVQYVAHCQIWIQFKHSFYRSIVSQVFCLHLLTFPFLLWPLINSSLPTWNFQDNVDVWLGWVGELFTSNCKLKSWANLYPCANSTKKTSTRCKDIQNCHCYCYCFVFQFKNKSKHLRVTLNLITSKIKARITIKILGQNIYHLLCLVIHMIIIVKHRIKQLLIS